MMQMRGRLVYAQAAQYTSSQPSWAQVKTLALAHRSVFRDRWRCCSSLKVYSTLASWYRVLLIVFSLSFVASPLRTMLRVSACSLVSANLLVSCLFFFIHSSRSFPASSVSEDLDDPRQQVRLVHFGVDPFISQSPLHAKQLVRTFDLVSPLAPLQQNKESRQANRFLERLLRPVNSFDGNDESHSSSPVSVVNNAFGELPSYMTKDWAQVGQELNAPWRLFGVPRYAFTQSISKGDS